MLVGEQLLVHFSSLKLALYGAVVIATVLMFPGGLVSLVNRFGFLKRRAILAPSKLPQGNVPVAAVADSGTGSSLLEVRDLSVRFGGLLALDGVSFKLRRGETLSVIGANGAGKTTLFNAITGFVLPTSGEILFRGRTVSTLPVIGRVGLGMARTFQIPRLLAELSVWENVVLAARHGRQKHRPVEHAAWVLRTVGLDEMWLEPVARLTPGRQRELELARVLALQPDLVLLDEVMAGMTKEEQERVRNIIKRMSDFGVVGILCIEHVIAAIADLSDRMLVLDFGRKIAEGTPTEVLNDPVVIKAYLGEVQ
jgi:ABC-type branched-subunit amino acid transport system ATPase component